MSTDALDVAIIDDGEKLIVSDEKTSITMTNEVAQRFRDQRAIAGATAERDASFLRGFLHGVHLNLSTQKE